MKGTRIDNPPGLLKPGEYGKIDGYWHGCPPQEHVGFGALFANLSGHDITEHEDGTITVSPSILITQHDGQTWHGYLERGVWREC